MLSIRRSSERGRADHGWLKSRHTFSFADYHDPDFMGWSVLRVINEDRIQGGTGFGTHGHRDMEIVSYVISGALEHQDSMGNKTVIRPGEVQRMSAGTGVQHSEINHYADQESHFLQIWILPDKMGRTPSYGQKDFTERLQSEALVQVLSPNGGAGSIAIHQDVNVFVSRARQGSDLDLPVSIQRRGWLQLISGAVEVLGESLKDGDGLAISKTASAKLATNTDAHFLYFDLP